MAKGSLWRRVSKTQRPQHELQYVTRDPSTPTPRAHASPWRAAWRPCPSLRPCRHWQRPFRTAQRIPALSGWRSAGTRQQHEARRAGSKGAGGLIWGAPRCTGGHLLVVPAWPRPTSRQPLPRYCTHRRCASPPHGVLIPQRRNSRVAGPDTQPHAVVVHQAPLPREPPPTCSCRSATRRLSTPRPRRADCFSSGTFSVSRVTLPRRMAALRVATVLASVSTATSLAAWGLAAQQIGMFGDA